MGRKHYGRIKKLSGNTAMEGMQIEGLTFPMIYALQTGHVYPTPERLPLPLQRELEFQASKNDQASG